MWVTTYRASDERILQRQNWNIPAMRLLHHKASKHSGTSENCSVNERIQWGRRHDLNFYESSGRGNLLYTSPLPHTFQFFFPRDYCVIPKQTAKLTINDGTEIRVESTRNSAGLASHLLFMSKWHYAAHILDLVSKSEFKTSTSISRKWLHSWERILNSLPENLVFM